MTASRPRGRNCSRVSRALGIGALSFAAPFVGCAALAYWGLHWSVMASWLAGVAMSTTSVAVVYAVMLETGLNKTTFGKSVLAACFVTDMARPSSEAFCAPERMACRAKSCTGRTSG